MAFTSSPPAPAAPDVARPRPGGAVRALARRLGYERVLLLVGSALIALHVLDDGVLQPQPGTTAGDHLVSTLVPLALLGAAVWAAPRLRGGARGTLELLVGVGGIVAGIEAAHYTSTVGASGDDYTGLAALAAGVLVLGTGVVTLWRTRRRDGGLGGRVGRRVLIGVAGAVVTLFIVYPAGESYVVTHTARSVVPAPHLGAPHQDVSFTTSDGLRLSGWYVPSRNGAAVIAFPGRKGPQRQTRMLVRHGYGVLLFDRRGEGRSEGDPNAFGWGGTKDLDAAIAFLRQRPDVEPDRIGGLGLSVGGEMFLEAAAHNDAVKAVVSEGAGIRSIREAVDSPSTGLAKAMEVAMFASTTVATAVSTGTTPPANLADLVPKIAPRPVLLIHAGISPAAGENLNAVWERRAPEHITRWRVAGARHMGAIEAEPAEYERRVAGFFDDALR